METSALPHRVSFGAFDHDLRTGELRKNGLKLRLPEQSFQIQALLLEHPSGVGTREEFQERIWGSDTFVDFEHSLAPAV